MKLIIPKILISAIVIIFLAWLLPGVHVNGTLQAILAALVIALINAILRPVLVFVTLPVTVVTLGLFLFVINALMIMLASHWLEGFDVDGFWWALLFSFLLSLLSSVIQGWLLKGHDSENKSNRSFR